MSVDDLPDQLPPLVVLVGDEELLVTRAIARGQSIARAEDPERHRDREGRIRASRARNCTNCSARRCSATRRLVVLRSAQDIRAAAMSTRSPAYLETPGRGHDTACCITSAGRRARRCSRPPARRARSRSPARSSPAPPSAPTSCGPRCAARGGRIEPAAVAALLDAVGSDLRELAATSSQLVSDSGGTVDVELVRAYHQGRAEVSGFAIADLAVVGNVPGALEALRYALDGRRAARGDRRRARRRRPHGRAGRVGRPGEQRVPAGEPARHAAVEGEARRSAEPRLDRAGRAAGAQASWPTLNADVKGEAVEPRVRARTRGARLADARAIAARQRRRAAGSVRLGATQRRRGTRACESVRARWRAAAIADFCWRPGWRG